MTISQRTTTLDNANGRSVSAYVAIPDSGQGPGLLLLHDNHGLNDHAKHQANLLAEEGWVVMAPALYPAAGLTPPDAAYDDAGVAEAVRIARTIDCTSLAGALADAVSALAGLDEVTGNVGVIGYELGGNVALNLAMRDTVLTCAVAYDPSEAALKAWSSTPTIPTVVHVAGAAPDDAESGDARLTSHYYVGVAAGFDNRNHPHWNRPAHLMAKSRTLALLRDTLGPRYDLAKLWEQHLYTEFVDRDVDDSMDTMVDDPYVFVVPTVTGGTGKHNLHRWYSDHFHFQNPEDTELIPLSRTIGADRLVDEFVFCFTHDRVMDWILPGMPPTDKRIEIPMVAVVNFRGERLYHEHIWWDQASVLVQAGLLDPTGLPVTGVDQAAAIQDEMLPRNRLIPDWN